MMNQELRIEKYEREEYQVAIGNLILHRGIINSCLDFFSLNNGKKAEDIELFQSKNQILGYNTKYLEDCFDES